MESMAKKEEAQKKEVFPRCIVCGKPIITKGVYVYCGRGDPRTGDYHMECYVKKFLRR